MSRLADEGGPPIDDLNACYQRPPIIDNSHAWKTTLTWTDSLANAPAAMDASRERPPIKHFVKESGEPAVRISGEPDPEGLKEFDEKISREWKTPLTWTGGLDTPDVRTFATGATRDTEEGKNDYVGFLSPLVIEAFGDYMQRHRVQSDGSLRDSDNWKLGQPKSVYIKSAFRHFLDLWKEHCGYASGDGIDEALGGLLFNIMGYWLEYLREREVKC